MLHWITYYLSGKFIDLNISSDMNIPDMSAIQSHNQLISADTSYFGKASTVFNQSTRSA